MCLGLFGQTPGCSRFADIFKCQKLIIPNTHKDTFTQAKTLKRQYIF